MSILTCSNQKTATSFRLISKKLFGKCVEMFHSKNSLLLTDTSPVYTKRESPQLSIIVPCYNEAENIKILVSAIDKALSSVAWEIIFVDDNSPDNTIDVIRECAARDPRIRGIRRVGRKGLSSAVIEGVLSSSAPFAAVMDGDLQHDECCLVPMLREITEHGYDLVVASRYVVGGDDNGLDGIWRHFLSKGGSSFTRRLLSIQLQDPMSGFFMFKRALFEKTATRMSGAGFKILLDLICSSSLPLKIKEVPTTFKPRRYGESKLDFGVILNLLKFIARMKMKKVLGGIS
ncbi:polyprenol monophosphomannose synthase [Acetobacter senegalensis]|uniref:polyprenol monophosphomannose synthase n=1 Tax=Acetobacter senegalensis TaxID=446692 RepID=UPI00209E795C|nr:polyprenol monophosphomannose synthase [Acetobacter senegalensis]MCP1195815.1 polyprenol monophosphomannose synthase [Acetobacter senegalensis]